MKRTPLARKSPLRAKSRLKSRRSTSSPTKSQSRRLETITRNQCLACRINNDRGMPSAYPECCDAHHLTQGGRRIGHDATIGLCPWHHRGVKPFDSMTDAQATIYFGPSYDHGSKPFHEAYGSDAELLAMQDEILKGGGAV